MSDIEDNSEPSSRSTMNSQKAGQFAKQTGLVQLGDTARKKPSSQLAESQHKPHGTAIGSTQVGSSSRNQLPQKSTAEINEPRSESIANAGGNVDEGISNETVTKSMELVNPEAETSGRDSPFYGFPAFGSTPMVTPNTSLHDSTNEDTPYGEETPFGEGTGHQLVSMPPQLGILSENPSISQVENYLETLDSHIQHFSANYMLNEGWYDTFKDELENYNKVINEALKKTSATGCHRLLAKCYGLRASLTRHSMTLTSKAAAMKINPLIQRLQSSSPGAFRPNPDNNPGRELSYLSHTPSTGGADKEGEKDKSSSLGTLDQSAGRAPAESSGEEPTDNSRVTEELHISIPPEYKSLNPFLDLIMRRLEGMENKTRMLSQEPTVENEVYKVFSTYKRNEKTIMDKRLLRLCDLERKVDKLEQVLNDDIRDVIATNGTNSNQALKKCVDLEVVQQGQTLQLCQTDEALQNQIKRLDVLEITSTRYPEVRVAASQKQAITPTGRPRVSGIAELPTTTVNSIVTLGQRSHGLTSLTKATETICSTRHQTGQVPCQLGSAGLLHSTTPSIEHNLHQQLPAPPATSILNLNRRGLDQQGSLNTNLGQQACMNPGTPSFSGEHLQGSASRETSLDMSNASDESGSVQNLSAKGLRLKRDGKNLRRMLTPRVDSSLTKLTVQSINKNVLTLISHKEEELAKALDRYENSPNPDMSLISLIDATICDAQEWGNGMREKYRELDCDKKSLDKKLYDGLKQFGTEADEHIFEFLRKFEALTQEQGTAVERATLLYEQYLSKDIQLDLVGSRHDYLVMRNWLVNRFGDIKVITNNIIKVLVEERIPDETTPYHNRASYFRKLNAVIAKLKDLFKTVDIPSDRLEAHIYSNDFLEKLLKLVPWNTDIALREKLILCGEDTLRVEGKKTFQLLTLIIHSQFTSLDAAKEARGKGTSEPPVAKSSPKRRKTVHNVVEADDGTSSDNEESCGVHYQSAQAPSSPKVINFGGQFKFPCTLKNHSHELGECAEFFSMTPEERQSLGKKKVCYTCMGPKMNCKSKCSNEKKIPAAAICKKCKEWADKRKWSPLNVLYCKKKDHEKPSNKALVAVLENWVKGFVSSKIQAPVQLAAHLEMIGFNKKCNECKTKSCVCKPMSKTSPVNKSNHTPVLNTNSGKEVKVGKDKNGFSMCVEESQEDAFYVMQLLNLKGEDCLTFYDRGANQHLIDGKMAEKLGAKVVSDRPSRLGIVGGGQIWTEYGKYKLAIGPNPLGYYHEITAQGIESITEPFPHYNLDQINKALVKSEIYATDDLKLPEYIGGQRVNLLIGLKETELEPKNMFQLPCGIGVYKSQWVDKFGSNICYGGPHELFSKINKKFEGNFNHINVFMCHITNEYRNSLYPTLTRALEPELGELTDSVMYLKEESTLRYDLPCDSGGKLYPTPLTCADFEELGSPEVNETEEETFCQCKESEPWAVHYSHSVHKARVPLSKLKDFVDEDDIGNTVNFRCSSCLKCKKCMVSDKVKMMSLQEVVEDEILENSVEEDHINKRILVDLPFVKPPVEFLTRRHKGNNNYQQANRVYKRQCKKPDTIKAGMRKMHAELISKGFMKKLSDLSQEQQEIIKKAGFQHFMPWSPVEKPESLSTKVRLVVDPSMSGLNLILAKGSNKLARIFNILVRSRCKRHVWTTDVSKLYNQLVLKDTALPYGLFLYHNSMDSDITPEIYVMMVAWYGVTSSCNQSGIGLEKITKSGEEEFPLAYPIIVQDRFVDDIFSGDQDEGVADQQIEQVRSAIGNGNFSLKYVVRSGEEPCKEASADGTTVKVLGVKWDPVADVYSPGFEEINFNKKSRGAKAPNPFPVTSPQEVNRLLSSKNVSRRMVISKLAEIYDPIGLWEPFKLQLKLEAKELNGVDWDVALEPDIQAHWKSRFQQFLEIPDMKAHRCIVPLDAVNPYKIRLLCLSDAAVSAGGCAIYGSYKRADGSYSCKLLAAKSRMMKFSIPRNELEAVRLMAELANDVALALGNMVEEILFFTDSTIAMSWCHNLNKKLRLFVFNRVAEVRRLITEVCPQDGEFPLFHIDGKENIADLLTKTNDISPKELGLHSTWNTGKEWMKSPLEEMPITRYSDISVTPKEEVSINEECFPEAFLTANSIHIVGKGVSNNTHCHGCRAVETRIPHYKCYGIEGLENHCNDCHCQIKFSSFLLKEASGTHAQVDIIKHGYLKSLRIMGNVLRFVSNLKHKLHQKKGNCQVDSCLTCQAVKTSGDNQEETPKVFFREALNCYLRWEAKRMEELTPKKKLDTFVKKDGIYYQAGRLSEENPITDKDLTFKVFFDSSSIKTVLPVVLSDSDIFFSLVMHIHHRVRKHSGVEITLKEVLTIMYVLNNPRGIIQKIRKNCSKCRMIAKKTLELEMAQHPEERTQIAPPFYNCMADTVFGFKGQIYKKARKCTKIYALIVVCLLTSAVNILALEGLETQDVLQAFERHASRHGIPAAIYVDNGTQLAALENVDYSLRDVNAQVHDSMGMKIITSTAKSHEERGRVERKVRTLREMLEKVAVKDDTCMTALQWETLFSKLSSQVNDLPMAKSDRSNFTDAAWDLLTPNRLMLGRNNSRSLEGSFNLLKGAGATDMLRRNQNLQHYFYQMLVDRLHNFIHRPLKWSKTDKVKVGDICIFVYKENPGMNKNVWKLGEVTNAANQRKLEITFPGNSVPGKLPKLKTIIRSPRQVCIIFAVCDADLNSREFFEKIVSEQ